jgi:hypothetical protein
LHAFLAGIPALTLQAFSQLLSHRRRILYQSFLAEVNPIFLKFFKVTNGTG